MDCDSDICDCSKRDEEGLLRRGVHIEPFELRGKKVFIRTNVISEKDPRLESTTIIGDIYEKRNPTFIYKKNGDEESLEIHNNGGLHNKSVQYLAREIYRESKNITIIPPEKCTC